MRSDDDTCLKELTAYGSLAVIACKLVLKISFSKVKIFEFTLSNERIILKKSGGQKMSLKEFLRPEPFVKKAVEKTSKVTRYCFMFIVVLYHLEHKNCLIDKFSLTRFQTFVSTAP